MPEPRSAATNAATEDPKRQKILDAALAVFCERTFAGCNVPSIAERAGVATGTIYRYFPSKEALLNELYRTWKGELRRRLVDDGLRLDPGDDARAVFDHWWTALTGFVRDEPQAFEFLELHHHEPYLDDDSHGEALAIDAAALAFVEAGQQVGALRDDQAPAVLIALVYGALAGLFRAHRLYGELVDTDAYDQAGDAVWDMVRNRTSPDPTPDSKDEP